MIEKVSPHSPVRYSAPLVARCAGALALAFALTLATLDLAAAQPPTAIAPAASKDPLAPRSDPKDSPIGPLDTITVVTADGEGSRNFYREGTGMRERGPLAYSANGIAAVRALWGLPAGVDFEVFLFDRPQAPGGAVIRLIALRGQGASRARSIRPEWSGQRAGSLSIGFAVGDMAKSVERMAELGVATTAGVSELRLTRPDDGTPYTVQETHFKAPEQIYALGVARSVGMPPVAPVDPATGFGGPAYSGQTLLGSDGILKFYTEALGLEVRRDIELAAGGPTGGLALPAGTRFRFVQVFAPGSSTGYMVFLDMKENSLANPVASRPPNRGVAMWSFRVKSLDDAVGRLRRAGAQVASGPVAIDTPERGKHRALTTLAPDGFMVELFERPE